MKIEPEALYSMFDTLFLPSETPVKTVRNDINKLSVKRLMMLFDKKYTDEEKDFLNKILSAINIKPVEVETSFEISPETLIKIMDDSSGYILVWGINYPGSEKYTQIKKGEMTLIFSDSLGTIKNDQILKAKLWNCLKEVFVK